MARKPISQAEARRLRKRVQQLEQLLLAPYAGTHIDTITVNENEMHVLQTARKLNRVIILRQERGEDWRVHAVEVGI